MNRSESLEQKQTRDENGTDPLFKEENSIKKCSMNNFTESLKPWLDARYVHRVVINTRGQVIFTFLDGISDTYEITDCSRQQVENVCRDLAAKGITVEKQPSMG